MRSREQNDPRPLREHGRQVRHFKTGQYRRLGKSLAARPAHVHSGAMADEEQWCPTCSGFGELCGSWVKCPTCKGTGKPLPPAPRCPRNARLVALVTRAELAAIRAQAEAAGLSVGAWVRKRVLTNGADRE